MRAELERAGDLSLGCQRTGEVGIDDVEEIEIVAAVG